MHARRPSGPPERDNVADLGERESHPAGLRYEPEQPKDIERIPPVASRRPLQGRKDSHRFVDPQGLAAEAASGGHFSDEKRAALHGKQDKACPMGQSQVSKGAIVDTSTRAAYSRLTRMTKRCSAIRHVLVVAALLTVLGHVCALPGHAHAAGAAGDHHGLPTTDHEHSDGDAVHAASCEAVRSASATVGTPILIGLSPRASITAALVDAPLRAAESTPPTSSPPLYLTHRALLI